MNQKKVSAESPELNQFLAHYLLALAEGEKLLNVRELAKSSGASTGSVSRAINTLEEAGAISIIRRGRLGSFLEKKSLGYLWDIIEDGPMVFALTMPSFQKCESLATAFYCMLNDAGVETYIIFIRGSYNRLKALRDGRCHAAVMSVLAAEDLCRRKEEILIRLPAESFVTDHRIFFHSHSEQPSRPLRVAIDNDSYDLKFLTEMEFADVEVEYKHVTYTQIGHHLLEGYVDAAVWNIDHMESIISENISSRPLSPKVQALIGDRDTATAVVITAGDKSLKSLLEDVLDPEQIMEIQHRVLSGEMVPRY